MNSSAYIDQKLLLDVSLTVSGEITLVHNKTSGTYLGILDFETGKALGHLSDHHRVHFVAFVPARRKENHRTGASNACDIHIIVYGLREELDAVGTSLADDEVYLQHPNAHDEAVLYDNPHYLKRPGSEIEISELPISQTNRQLSSDKIASIFDSARGPHIWSEVSVSLRLQTPLKM